MFALHFLVLDLRTNNFQFRNEWESSSKKATKSERECEEYTNQMKHIVTLLCSVRCECICFSESDFDSCCCFYCVIFLFFFGGFHSTRKCACVYVCDFAMRYTLERMDRACCTAAASTYTRIHIYT